MILSYGTMLTVTQALQLVGLVPCLFLILFLLLLALHNSQAIIPIFYFIALAAGFALPLLPLSPLAHSVWAVGILLLLNSTLTAFSFLLICQFMINRIPPPPYWLVLAIPLLGGSPLIYAGIVQANASCLSEDQGCPNVASIKTLYDIFSSAFVFLLLIYYSSRSGAIGNDDGQRKHKYWLVIALIMLNLLGLAVALAEVSGHLAADQEEFITVVFRFSFIYLVLTSLFRVFYPGLGGQAVHLVPRAYNPAADLPHAEKIRILLETERVYRNMRLNRAALAKMTGIHEHHLSRVINGHFKKSFNELINGYRIEEAKRRLKTESSQITTIGFEVGFNSIASFNRVFKSSVGMSPSDYRNSVSGGASSL